MSNKFEHHKIDRLLKPERYRELDPEKLLRAEGLGPGGVVADIGCGPGFFTIPAAEIVGPGGMVYALDTQEDMLRSLEERNPPENVKTIVNPEDSLPLPDASVDLALFAYALHETGEGARDKLLGEILRVLKPGARLLLIDWEDIEEDRGPPRDERVPSKDAAGMLAEAGFTDIATGMVTESHYRISAARRS